MRAERGGPVLPVLRSLLGYWLLECLLFAADLWTGAQISLWFLYVLPIGLATWNIGRMGGVATLLVGLTLELAAAAISGHPFLQTSYFVIALLSRVAAWGTVVSLVLRLRAREVVRVVVPDNAHRNSATTQKTDDDVRPAGRS